MADEKREARLTPWGREEMLRDHDDRLGKVEDQLLILPVIKRILAWVAVLLSGAIVAVIGAAITVILTAGGAK